MPSTPTLPQVREICNVISNDIQPVGNLRVLNRVGSLLGPEPAEKAAGREAWARHFISSGFAGADSGWQWSCVCVWAPHPTPLTCGQA